MGRSIGAEKGHLVVMVGDIGDELRARREGESGHRSVPYSADTRVQAWGTTREHCLAEAVRAMVDSFADVSGARPRAVERIRPARGRDEDLLVALLDEVVLRLETAGRVPVDVDVTAVGDGGVEARLSVADLADVEITGAVPRGVSWQGVRIGPDALGWSCTATVDV
ncbi:archease [Streptomyces sp. NPDC004561]